MEGVSFIFDPCCVHIRGEGVICWRAQDLVGSEAACDPNYPWQRMNGTKHGFCRVQKFMFFCLLLQIVLVCLVVLKAFTRTTSLTPNNAVNITNISPGSQAIRDSNMSDATQTQRTRGFDKKANTTYTTVQSKVCNFQPKTLKMGTQCETELWSSRVESGSGIPDQNPEVTMHHISRETLPE